MTKKVKINKNFDFQRLLELEWLETNNIGGYASSSVINCHTRKYHGLLTVKLQNPPGKFVLLSNIEDSISLGQNEYFLTSHMYPNAVYPEGYKNLDEFTVNTVPSFNYRIVKKQIMLVPMENTLLIKYSGLKKGIKAKLSIKPLLAFRNFHKLSHENQYIQFRTYPCHNGFFISPYSEMPSLFIQINTDFRFQPSPDWYRNFEYIEEKKRGFECHEDLFTPGVMEIYFQNGEEIVFSVSTREQKETLTEKWEEEIFRRHKQAKKFKGTFFQKTLLQAADQFIVMEPQGNKSIIAGYPWFLEWGRDAMISLPGLTLYSGREKDCLEILKTFALYEKDGLIPNFIGDTPDKTAYNSADASLWFAWATQKYLEKTKNFESVRKFIWPILKRIFFHYKKGTLCNIKMMPDGLLKVGGKDLQITWMDATVNGKPSTPREGCPVEINALWYNLVCFLDNLGKKFQDDIVNTTSVLINKIKSSFNEHFWIPEDNYLGDVYKENGSLDKTFRPNQLFAVSLPYSPLSIERSQKVLALIQKELLTSRGLRTLSPKDKNYYSKYQGGPDERDSAYHNGTVWPWLMGHYGEAILKIAPHKEQAALKLEEFLHQFEAHFTEGGFFTVSEIFDGNPPHLPHGCISQAWSVAELLRLSYLIKKVI